MSFTAVDGPSLQSSLTVTTTTVVEVKGGSDAYTDRKIITLQPIGGSIYVYFANSGEVPSATDVQNKGFLQFRLQINSYEAGQFQAVYILAISATTDVRLAERA